MTPTFESHTYLLQSGVDAGLVWNADFENAKFYLNRLVETDFKALDLYKRTRDVPFEEGEVSWGPSSVHDVRAYGKRARRWMEAHKDHETVDDIALYLIKWEAVVKLFDEAKPLIKKGRKPSDDPSKTPDRTLENTGTCPVCGKNVKLNEAGGLVLHGYSVGDREYVGRCFAVSMRPLEVSPEGLSGFASLMARKAEGTLNYIAKVKEGTLVLWAERRINFRKTERIAVNPGDEGYDKLQEAKVRELEYEHRNYESLKTEFTKRAEDWRATTLPGIKAGFAR